MVLPACSSVFQLYHPAVDELDDSGLKQPKIYFYTDCLFKIILFIGISSVKMKRKISTKSFLYRSQNNSFTTQTKNPVDLGHRKHKEEYCLSAKHTGCAFH